MVFRVKTNRGGYAEWLLKQERFASRKAALERIADAKVNGIQQGSEIFWIERHGAPIYVVEE